MKITRKTRISYIAEKKTSIIPQKETTNVGFCHLCEAEMIPAQIAGEYFNVSSRTIYRLIEADKIHFFEAEDHNIFICPVSFEKNRDFGNAAEQR